MGCKLPRTFVRPAAKTNIHVPKKMNSRPRRVTAAVNANARWGAGADATARSQEGRPRAGAPPSAALAGGDESTVRPRVIAFTDQGRGAAGRGRGTGGRASGRGGRAGYHIPRVVADYTFPDQAGNEAAPAAAAAVGAAEPAGDRVEAVPVQAPPAVADTVVQQGVPIRGVRNDQVTVPPEHAPTPDPSPARPLRASPHGLRSQEVMGFVLENLDVETFALPLGQAGLMEVQRFMDVSPPPSVGWMRFALGSAEQNKAIKYALGKLRATAAGLPHPELHSFYSLQKIAQYLNDNGGVVSGLLTKDLFGARERPPSDAEDERESSFQSPVPNSQKEHDLETADNLVQNVTQQNNGRPPPVEHQACTPDILLAHDCLQRVPPRCAGASFLSLRSRAGGTTDEGQRHRRGKTFKHDSKSYHAVLDQMVRFLIAHGYAGAFIALPQTVGTRVDVGSGCIDAVTGEEAVLFCLMSAVRDAVEQVRIAMHSLRASPKACLQYFENVVVDIDAEFAQNSDATFTACLAAVMRRRHERNVGSLGGGGRHRGEESSSDDDSSGSSDSEEPVRKARSKKRAPKKDKKVARKSSKKSPKGGRSGGNKSKTKPTGLCFQWARRQVTSSGRGCSKSSKDCTFRHKFEGKDKQWAEDEYN